MINMGAHTLFSLIDLYWIGSLGTDAIAAVALCGNIMFSMFGLTVIIESGALAMLSRRSAGFRELRALDDLLATRPELAPRLPLEGRAVYRGRPQGIGYSIRSAPA